MLAIAQSCFLGLQDLHPQCEGNQSRDTKGDRVMDQLSIGRTDKATRNQVMGIVVKGKRETRRGGNQSKEEEDDGDETIKRLHLDEDAALSCSSRSSYMG
jgi:hypothetical protein